MFLSTLDLVLALHPVGRRAKGEAKIAIMSMNLGLVSSLARVMNFTQSYRSQLVNAISSVDLNTVEQAIAWLGEARDNNGHIFVCGNGGSAATASHFTCDILKGASFQRDRRFRILALTDSLPTLTAYSNDVCYECVFEEQLKNFAQKEDVIMAISASGNSPNVVRAVEYGNSIGCRTVALTGRDGGKLGGLAQLNIQVRAEHMGRIEDTHLIICHMIAYHFMEN
jgi:D-sedoheptulose 7-phosphate isomerase